MKSKRRNIKKYRRKSRNTRNTRKTKNRYSRKSSKKRMRGSSGLLKVDPLSSNELLLFWVPGDEILNYSTMRTPTGALGRIGTEIDKQFAAG